jgi:hypothetical protein
MVADPDGGLEGRETPLLELDLGETARREPLPNGPAPRGRRPAPGFSPGPRWAWALAAGAVLGGLAVHLLDGGATPAPAPAAPPQLRVAFGALASQVEPQLDHGLAVVDLFAVVVNDGTTPLTLDAVHVTGPGAALVDPGPRWATPQLPMVVPPGEERDLPLAVTSDCAVAVRPLPAVSLAVRGPDGAVREQPARVPDLARLWGQTLDGGPCPDPSPFPSHSYAP